MVHGMRFLLLGNSQNNPALGYPHGIEFLHLRDRLAELTGEPVDARFAVAFPTETLHRHVTRVVTDFDPQIVILHCTGLWVVSVFTLQHWLAQFKPPLVRKVVRSMRRTLDVIQVRLDTPQPHGAAGRVSTVTSALARRTGLGPIARSLRHTLDLNGVPLTAPPRGLDERVYAFLYGLGLRAGWGTPWLPVEVAVERYAAVIRLLATREDTLLLVRGSAPVVVHAQTPALARRSAAVLNQFERGISAACERQRVPFISLVETFRTRPSLGRRLRDSVHIPAESQRQLAEDEIAVLTPLLAR
jgi:hypothetical protein